MVSTVGSVRGLCVLLVAPRVPPNSVRNVLLISKIGIYKLLIGYKECSNTQSSVLGSQGFSILSFLGFNSLSCVWLYLYVDMSDSLL